MSMIALAQRLHRRPRGLGSSVLLLIAVSAAIIVGLLAIGRRRAYLAVLATSLLLFGGITAIQITLALLALVPGLRLERRDGATAG